MHFLDPRQETYPIHYAIETDSGCRVGQCWVVWRGKFGSSLQDTWVLSKIWIEPEFRRQGWLRNTWETLHSMYDGIQPEPPLSSEAWQFFATRPEVAMSQMFPMMTLEDYG
jgi:hypothetical protein